MVKLLSTFLFNVFVSYHTVRLLNFAVGLYKHNKQILQLAQITLLESHNMKEAVKFCENVQFHPQPQLM